MVTKFQEKAVMKAYRAHQAKKGGTMRQIVGELSAAASQCTRLRQQILASEQLATRDQIMPIISRIRGLMAIPADTSLMNSQNRRGSQNSDSRWRGPEFMGQLKTAIQSLQEATQETTPKRQAGDIRDAGDELLSIARGVNRDNQARRPELT